MSDKRLIIVSPDQSHANVNGHSHSNYEVELKNAANEFQNKVRGISVDTVSFPNLIPNVREGRNSLLIRRDGVDHTITIPGNEFYSLNMLQVNIDLALIAEFGGVELRLSVLVGGGADGKDRLEWDINDADGVNIYEIVFDHDTHTLANVLGVTESIFMGGGSPATAETMTMLYGEPAVCVTSRHLIAGKIGARGGGAGSNNVLVVIPITVPFGAMQTWRAVTHQNTVQYGRFSSNSGLTSIDLQLRYLDGSLIPLSNGDLVVSLRTSIGARA